MSIILQYTKQQIDEKTEEWLTKTLFNNLTRVFNFGDFYDEVKSINEKGEEIVIKKTPNRTKFNQWLLKNINAMFSWKRTGKKASDIYLYFLVEMRKTIPLYTMSNSIFYMEEDEILAYLRILSRDFKPVLTEEFFKHKPKVKEYSLYEMLEFRGYKTALKMAANLEKEWRDWKARKEQEALEKPE